VTQSHEIWRDDGILAAYSSPTLVAGRLYVVDKTCRLFALDALTGKRLWDLKVGREGWGSPVYADGKIMLAEVDAQFHMIRPGDASAEIISSIEFKSDLTELVDIRGCPAIAYGRIYLMTRTALYCLGEGDKSIQQISVSSTIPEGPPDSEVAAIQVVPADVQIDPHDAVQFEVRTFDSKGRPIGTEARNVAWSVQGLVGGMVNDNGLFEVGDDGHHGQFGKVVAKVGDALTAEARVRVFQPLPIEENFENVAAGAAPTYWIGATRVKYQTVVEEDGNHVFRKTSDDRRFWRSLVYMGPDDMSDYTVQADVRLHEANRMMPEAGLINSRYVFDIRANEFPIQKLRLVGWVPMPRVVKEIDFVAEKDVWYTMKMAIDYRDNGSATVKGKVWKRSETEPEAWTIEMEDPQPYRNGSPGLANFSMADVDYDNVRVTPND
jgi:hypothetical protein